MDFWLKIEMIKRLVPDPKMEILNGEEIVWNDERTMPTDSEILTELEKYNNETKQFDLFQKVDKLADTKTSEARNLITGKRVTNDQLFRYEQKYEMALKYKTDGSYANELKWEAELTGMTTDKLVDLIITTGKEYDYAIKKFVAMIEAFRVKLGILIREGRYNDVESIIAEAYRMDVAEMTIDNVKKLLTKYNAS